MERMHLKHRLTAVLIADVVGYSRLMGDDEESTHVRLADHIKCLIAPKIEKNHGRLIRTAGDGLLVGFDSAIDAVRCGLNIQRELADYNVGVATDRRIQLRIGINTGDVIVEDGDIYGNSVNIAARLEELAEPGQIYVTRAVRDQLQGYPDLLLEDRGERRVKNIKTPIRVYRVKQAEEPQRQAVAQRIVARAGRLFSTQSFVRRRSAVVMIVGLALTAAVTVGALPVRRDYSLMSPRASIMVLPFRNAGGNPQDDYLADAITDDLTIDLSRLADTSVIAPATAFTYKGRAADPREIGREFGVRYLLEGSIRKIGLKVQTNAQLLDTRSAAHIWADRFDDEITDLINLQEAVTGRIASSLHIQLIKAEHRRAIAERATDPDAVDLRLHAMALLITSFTPESCLAARRYLEESTRLDPGSADAWAQLAWVLSSDYMNRWNEAEKDSDARKTVLARAEQALEEALKLDPSIALAHFADGSIRRAKGDHQGSLEAFDRALQLDPNFALAYSQKAGELILLGRAQEAPPLVLKAIRLSPRDPSIGVFYWVIGRAFFVMQNYEDAIVWLRKSVEVRPNLWFTRAYLLSAYALTGRTDDANAALTELSSKFTDYNLQFISNVYSREIYPNADFRSSVQELYRGLQLAGLQ